MLNCFDQGRDPFAGQGRDGDTNLGVEFLRRLLVDLVERHEHRELIRTDLDQCFVDRLSLRLCIGVRNVDDVKQEIGLGDLLQGRSEGSHQSSR